MLVPPPPPSPLPSPRRRPRIGVLLAAAAAATLLHWWLLAGDERPATAPGIAPPPPVQVRSLDLVVPAAVAAPAAPPLKPVNAAMPAPKRAAKARPADSAPVSEASAPAVTAQAAPEIVKVAASAATTGGDDEPVPVYRTQMPQSATLHYAMRRGMLSGSGELQWKPAGERYELRLDGRVAGVHVLTETSIGLIDAHGLAPLRFTDTRVRRGTSAANFQRDKGKITYSGPQAEYALLPGSQDRLSWMMQLAAVLNAQPGLAVPGGRVIFFVSGAHGDAETWIFRSSGADTVSSEAGPLAAVKFTREPRKAYDRTVEIWLAPARQHLPVRARFTAPSNGEVFELLLRDMQSP